MKFKVKILPGDQYLEAYIGPDGKSVYMADPDCNKDFQIWVAQSTPKYLMKRPISTINTYLGTIFQNLTPTIKDSF